jgi:hypothetical protein
VAHRQIEDGDDEHERGAPKTIDRRSVLRFDPEKKLRLGTFGPALLWVMASTLARSGR